MTSRTPSVGEGTTPAELFSAHGETLDRALVAVRDRSFWSAYPEHPGAYGDDGIVAGKAAFDAHLGREFSLEQVAVDGFYGGERSPYGLELGISYAHSETEALLEAMKSAIPAWRDAGPEARAGVCLEILGRLNARSHEIAHAVMHTTGQAYMMAFQAGGPHAQDRGLEAVTYAYAEMTRHCAEAVWEKPQGKRPPLRLQKRFSVVPRGVALVIGCNTFPTWNSYPGFFASLATGNAVLVKASRRAVLPLAITVAVAREVLAEAGFSPDLVSLAADAPGERLASTLAIRPDVRIVDYTGSSEFGEWLEENARQAVVFTEKAGVNSVIVDSTDDYRGLLSNLAFTLSLYSGQMCTTPQNILVPRGGIETDDGHKSFDQFGDDLAEAIAGLLGDDARATAILGAIVGGEVLERIEESRSQGRVVLESRAIAHSEFPDAVVRTPLLIALDGPGEDAMCFGEQFGPITFVIATDDTAASIELFRATTARKGAITAAVYSNDEATLVAVEEAARDAAVALSCNLTGGIYVNQSAAFSDFHATGGNPAANASFTDGAYVASRFRIVQSRRPIVD